MMTMTSTHDEMLGKVLSAVQAAGSVLLFSHVSPDGDTLGSALALRHRIARMGKRVRVMLDGQVPNNLRFLPGWDEILPPMDTVESCDLALSVDVSCYERLGACARCFDAAPRTAQVDHHGTNEGFAQINAIDAEAPATAMVVFRLFELMDMPISPEEAVCLYTALSTDTGNFIYPSTTAESFRMMAALMDAGLPLAQYGRRLFRNKELSFVRLLGAALPTLRLTCEGKVAGIRVTRAQMEQAEATSSNVEGLVNYAIDIEGVKLAYFLREQEDGRVKGSLRAIEPYRVDEAAKSFGGGGHRLASGMTMTGTLDETVAQVEAALAKALEDGHAGN